MVDLEKLKQCQAILAHHGGDPVYEMVPAIIAELTALRAKAAAGEVLRERLELDYHDLPASAQGAADTYDNATGWTMPGEDAAVGVE